MRKNGFELSPAGRRRFLLLSGGGIAAAVIGLGGETPAEAAGVVKVSMKILTGKMIGRPGWPQFQPGNLKLPANRLVEVTVRCYDDGNASLPGGYNEVTGTIGNTMRLIKGTPASFAPDAGTVVKEVPVKDVAHTFTVKGGNFFLNVPFPPLSTVVYRFMTPVAGKYSWQCMSACGTGAGGWAGSMDEDGWMKGTVTVE